MKLIAKRPCNFNGKKYFIGDEIPASEVLDPKAQKSMGIIEVVEGEGIKAVPKEGGPTPASLPTLDTDNEEECAEESADVSYSKSTLVRMNKEELVEFAASKGIEVDADMKKEDIADLILGKKGE